MGGFVRVFPATMLIFYRVTFFHVNFYCFDRSIGRLSIPLFHPGSIGSLINVDSFMLPTYDVTRDASCDLPTVGLFLSMSHSL